MNSKLAAFVNFAAEVETPVQEAEQFVFFGAAEWAAEYGILSEVAVAQEEEARQYYESHPEALPHFGGRRLA